VSTHKRLFLFAGYDRDGIIDDALIYYVSTLSKYGDVILCMDSNCLKSEINKIKQYTINTMALRHGEYDFGSYKRAFQYARNNNLLNNYDFVYLVNDSVFGPMFNIKKILENMEKSTSDATGLVVSKHKTHKFMESWFVSLNKKIFTSAWFDEFMSNVKSEEYKYIITVKYEHGLTNLIQNHNCSWSGLFVFYGRFTYNNPKRLFKLGCPFIKKASFARHNGGCGNQIKYVLKHANKNASKSVLKTANRVYGKQHMKWLLTSNLVKILIRKIKYATQKIKSGQI